MSHSEIAALRAELVSMRDTARDLLVNKATLAQLDRAVGTATWRLIRRCPYCQGDDQHRAGVICPWCGRDYGAEGYAA